MEQNTTPTVLSMQGISKKFPGVQALRDVRFDLRAGEFHAILGENGAGKSTLIKILGGIYAADEGEIQVRGRTVSIRNVNASRELGISIIHQELCLVSDMTVAENIYLGREPVLPGSRMVDEKRMAALTQEILEELEIGNIRPGDLVRSLSISKQQMVEIAKALSQNASIVVMDEPTSSLTETEVRGLFDFIRRCKEKGIAFIYISHRMDEIFEMADRITVLRDGTYIGTRVNDEVSYDELIRMMVGRDVRDMYHPVDLSPTGETLLEVSGLTTSAVEDVHFQLYKGEILGVFGLMGAGRTELARALFGIDRVRGGQVTLLGRAMPRRYGPGTAIRRGLALIPESRKEHGLVLIESVEFNLLLTVLERIYRFFRVNRRYSRETVAEYTDQLAIKAGSPQVLCETLSGGNQQKIVLAKWLATHPKILILDEPTRGIDIGAKSEIYAIMQKLAAEGVGVVMISSELPEIVNLSTRVMVMREGRVTAFLEKPDINQETIMRYAVGG